MAIRKKSSTKQKIINYPLQFKAEARNDIIEAAQWYAGQSEGLDKIFIQYLENTINIIQYNPGTFKKIYKDFRQAALKKFPYVVVYELEEETIIIYSVFHAKQHPRKKINRMNK